MIYVATCCLVAPRELGRDFALPLWQLCQGAFPQLLPSQEVVVLRGPSTFVRGSARLFQKKN